MSRKMLVIGMVCLVALLVVAVTAVPAQAQDCNFYLHAWDIEEFPPNYTGVPGLIGSFQFVSFDAWGIPRVWEFFNPGGGGLYWVTLTPQQLAGCITWEVQWIGGDGWDKVEPEEDNIFQGDIDFGGNNPADPQDWWLIEE